MDAVFWILIFFSTFAIMEFMAWFTHKYIMHGFLMEVGGNAMMRSLFFTLS